MQNLVKILITSLVASLVYMNLSRDVRRDPSVSVSNQAGVILNILDKNDQSLYFVVQNNTYSQECSVYTNAGDFLHQFPGEFCIFLENGDFVSYVSGVLTYFNNQLIPQWKKKMFLHHDLVISSERQEIAALTRPHKQEAKGQAVDDQVIIFNFKGDVVFKWSALAHREELERLYGKKLTYAESEDKSQSHATKLNITKLNSVQILPSNRLSSSLEAFSAGNIFVNDRLNSHFLILNRRGQIVWSRKMSSGIYRSGHSPRVQSNGNITFFENTVDWRPTGKELDQLLQQEIARRQGDGTVEYTLPYCAGSQSPLFYSQIIEFNPLNGEKVWEYSPKNKLSFCSSFFGYVQSLPNGHKLVSHISNGGSAFEVNELGEIVWEWVNPKKDESRRPLNIYKVVKVEKRLVDSLIKNIPTL